MEPTFDNDQEKLPNQNEHRDTERSSYASTFTSVTDVSSRSPSPNSEFYGLKDYGVKEVKVRRVVFKLK